MTIWRRLPLRRNDTGVIDQDVYPRYAGDQVLSEFAHFAEAREVRGKGGAADFVGDGAGSGHRAAHDDD
ncbi:hypothetical protein GCM10009680_64820 [Streptomyces yatensis]|uniref:Uncharacterized protein n=1 Tax=Streptomyces yatensis TaxID=155177 RepID=A0ABN2IZ76_9ACTN